MRSLLLLLLMLLWPAVALAQSRELQEVTLPGGSTIRYALLLPAELSEKKAYPVLCVLPPGNQNSRMIEAALLYFEEQAAERGWVVVCPAAPEGQTLIDLDAAQINAFLDHVATGIKAEGDRVHLAGLSSGGRAAFRWALVSPARFASLTVLPGTPPEEGDFAQLAQLKGLPVTMFVGERDTKWVEESRRALNSMAESGVNATLEIIKGQDHVVSVDKGRLFDLLDSLRPRTAPGTTAPGPQLTAINAVLDDFHLAAQQADEERYFGHFTEDAVFLGTDATERWTRDEFRAYARPYFAKGKAWTYVPRRRNVTLSPRADIAWFDEVTHNAKYGECRGTGVLVKVGTTWRIAQYNLVIPIPNSIAAQVMDLIRKDEMTRPAPKTK